MKRFAFIMISLVMLFTFVFCGCRIKLNLHPDQKTETETSKDEIYADNDYTDDNSSIVVDNDTTEGNSYTTTSTTSSTTSTSAPYSSSGSSTSATVKSTLESTSEVNTLSKPSTSRTTTTTTTTKRTTTTVRTTTAQSGGTTSKGFKIEVRNGITYVGGVLIANKTYSLPSSYNPGGLTSATNSAFNSMKAAAQKDGVDLWIASGFRSYEYQKGLYQRYVDRDGKKAADTYSARPGHSEHQSGLAMDLNSLKTSFGQTKEGKWLAANCWKYGFIIRYPESKQSVTGYVYEPWHVRYLGKDMAEKVYKSGLCLEEYLGITSVYQY